MGTTQDSHQVNDEAEVEDVGPLPEEDRVIVRLKFLNDTQKDVSASLVENIGLFDRCVVHCLIHASNSSQNQTSSGLGHGHSHSHGSHTHGHTHNHAPHRDLDVSAYFIPILGLALAMLWY